MAKRTFFRTLIVRLRMFYADIRGHHGKRWDYEPGDGIWADTIKENRKSSLYYV